MELTLAGRTLLPRPGQSLLDILREQALDAPELSRRPLAAKIAGEVFTLNYVPVRDPSHPDAQRARRAVAACGGTIGLLTYADEAGREVYTRTAQFTLFLALRQLWPKAVGKMNCTVGTGLYIQVRGAEDFDAGRLKSQVSRLVRQDIPLIRRRMTTSQAAELFRADGQTDKARLLSWRRAPYFDVYSYDGYMDYFYGEMMPSTGYLTVWDIRPAEGGFWFLFPDPADPDRVGPFRESPNFFSVFSEGERWCSLMACESVADLNDLTRSGNIRELIRVNEALHEKGFSQIADRVCRQRIQAVLLAGPSSSGKTTSAHRLATQLRVHGKKPVYMGLDDYYADRDSILPGPDGKLDLEHIQAIDTELFRRNLRDLLRGREVELPSFNFVTGRREWRGRVMRLEPDTVMIVEGLHALNPALLPADLDRDSLFRMYVSPLLPLNLDNHNRIPTSYLRLLRRIVRDYETRGSSVEQTVDMWDSVRRGEHRWIYPFQEQADVIFNSSTLYELAVLKKHIFPLLTAVGPEQSCYDTVRGAVKILNFVEEADVDDEIPPTSLVREFIGGNSFYRK